MNPDKKPEIQRAIISRLRHYRSLESDVDQLLRMEAGGHVKGCRRATCDGPCDCPREFFEVEVVKLEQAESIFKAVLLERERVLELIRNSPRAHANQDLLAELIRFIEMNS